VIQQPSDCIEMASELFLVGDQTVDSGMAITANGNGHQHFSAGEPLLEPLV
jgi:hypothetical protein